MHCAGANFSVIKFSGYQCDVDPFLDTYTTTKGVDVATAATAVQLSAGDVLYLVSSAALWFGDQMETSLFNGNILRDAGIEPCTDHIRTVSSAFGIELEDCMFPYSAVEISLA